MKTALVIGSTGLIGSQLVDLLVTSEHYEKVLIFVKRDSGKLHPKLEQHIINFDAPEAYQHLVKGDDVFCTIGTTIKKAGSQSAFRKVDYEYPIGFSKIAKTNNIKQFLIVSSLGANKDSNNFYLKTKGEMEAALAKANFETTVIVRPSLLLGHRSEFRLGEKIGAFFSKGFSFLLLGSLKKYRPIESSTVARALYLLAQSNVKGYTIYESDELQNIEN
ncbi:oxidoreductase [Flavobacterium sp. LM5]|uniref:NAD(P)H-binding protein n=1 Tax=Flavobacterium sp. LM5 TaxID=1938610 RepID=UPI00099418B7|nr:NAD(P)H-binding protein [Flavobacterium sp. LM5]OOV29399.1 oxidoreductase [Flavobacterium sp. LM5]